MAFLSNPLHWASVGIILVLAELILPGGIVIFLGLGALIVAFVLTAGLTDNWMYALTLWFIITPVLWFMFRGVTRRLFGGDITVANTDQDIDNFGTIVTVTQTIGPGQSQGRVTFLGAGWDAVGDGSEIPAGSKVSLVSRDNTVLTVNLI